MITLVKSTIYICALMVSIPSNATNNSEKQENTNILFAEEGYKILKPEEHDRNNERIRSNKPLEQLNQIPRVSKVLDRVRNKKLSLKSKGVDSNFDNSGFYEDFIPRDKLPFAIKEINTIIFENGNHSYLFVNNHRIRRVFSKTQYGAILIDEQKGASLTVPESNLTLAGKPALWVNVKHAKGQWATVVSGTSIDGQVVVVETNRRLQGRQLDEFIESIRPLYED